MEVFRLSVPPRLRLWQELQEMNPDLESRGSKKSFLPSSALASLVPVAGAMGSTGFCVAPAALATKETTQARRQTPVVFFMSFSRKFFLKKESPAKRG
ncbi:hypothetical protein H206_05371 [Candidatus Electrothrix aarhusensis]|uniref:Uncharacterized protein n=1 Tax=Candidatus Electrothrix aarhusensis TaxID=1859131 RepID=A0A3S3RU62_9BACT|nr:hypothetical protein H206_05371 [Candidatus Electrothrix aarhusensis]